MPGILQDCGGAGGVDSGVDLFDVEELAGVAFELGWRKRIESEDKTVGGKNDEACRIHVDEGHHDRVVGSRDSGGSFGGGAAFVAIGESGFVAMMPVGDDEFLVAHSILDGGDDGRVPDPPDAMDDIVFVGDFDVGSGLRDTCGSELGVDFSGAAIEHENLSEVGAIGSQEVEAIGFGFG